MGPRDKHPTNTPRKLTPPEVARRLRVSEDKVRAWIARGELRATNVAARRTGRPRWRIDPADLEAFEAGRVGGARRPAPAPRRRAIAGVIPFF